MPWAWRLPSRTSKTSRISDDPKVPSTCALVLGLCVALSVGTGVVVGAQVAGAARDSRPLHVTLGTAPPVSPAATVRPARGPDPARWVRTPPANSQRRHAATTTEPFDTLNWAGELSTGSTVRSVSGTWVVPTVLASATSRDSAEWIGVGGGSRSASGLIQTGTDQATDGGRTTDSVWYEILPGPAVTVVDPSTGRPMQVAAGDQMHASVAQVRPGLWRIDIDDVTQGWTASGTFAYHGTTTTAEWIVEAPTVRTRIETLADFHSVRFTDMQTVETDPAAAVLRPVDMVNEQREVIAYPGTVQPTATREVQIYYGAPGAGTPTPPATTSPATGYDVASAAGDVFAFDPAGMGGGYYGSLPGIHVVPRAPVVGIVAMADEHGYYLVGADGGVFAFGDAPYLGSLPGDGVRVDDVVGMAVTASSNGYWLVASSGEVYAFGAAAHLGTVATGGSPVTGIAPAHIGGGYWTVTADGAVEGFGSAKSFGSLPKVGVAPNRPVVDLVPTANTAGYWLVGADGGVFSFGDADFVGSLAAIATVDDIVGGIGTGA